MPDKLKILRSYKLQLDQLGYIVVNGEIKEAHEYRSLLRSGKVDCKVQYTNDRLYQYNDFMERYFNIKYKNINIHNIPSYKKLMYLIAFNVSTKQHHYKSLQSIANKLISLDYIKVTELINGDLIIKDSFNNNLYHAHNNILYLINNIPVKVYIK